MNTRSTARCPESFKGSRSQCQCDQCRAPRGAGNNGTTTHKVDVDFSRAGDPKCRCDICLAEIGNKAVSKRADVGAVIFWEAALVTALLESIGDGVSTAEAVTLAERHLKRIRSLADGLLRG